MKGIFIAPIFLIASYSAHPQYAKILNARLDSLNNLPETETTNSAKIACLEQLFFYYIWNYPDSSLPYIQQEVSLAATTKSGNLRSRANYSYGWFYLIIGDYPKAFSVIQQGLNIAEKTHNIRGIAGAHELLALIYLDEGDYRQGIAHGKIAKSLLDPLVNDFLAGKIDTTNFTYIQALWGLSQNYEKSNELGSAMNCMRLFQDFWIKAYGGKREYSVIPLGFGNVYSKLGNYRLALQYYHEGIRIADNNKDRMDLFNAIAVTYKNEGRIDSSVFYANKVLEHSKQTRYSIAQLFALSLLTDIYKSKNNIDSVAKYLQLTVAAKDSLFSLQKIVQIQTSAFDEQIRKQDEARQDVELKGKIRFYSVLGASAAFLIIAFLLWRNNRHKQKANILLQREKEKVESALNELKSTQTQLIQSEKMASLGELTAGIAHEIQNPLNFVNNFSEVNKELIDEASNANDSGNSNEVKVLLSTLRENQEKINFHGQRADAIVKGMLQHSRANTGQKEPININALADEYLRLAYHGFRAKDKSFNATMKTDFDQNIGTVNLVPQDIGRVLLNLYNNAFYAVSAKKKLALDGYEPTLSVTTKKLNGKIEIKVKDNGNGIPQKVIDKIFQPFFTTKPAGQGTGLGLSMSYDITKAHGGHLGVHTSEGEYAEFQVELPI